MKACYEGQRPVLILQDLSNPHVAQTPYSRKRGQAITDLYPELRGRIAFILPNTLQSLRIQLFLRKDVQNRARLRDVFFSREQALAWLKKGLQRPCEQAKQDKDR
jgi:hypothetical protein